MLNFIFGIIFVMLFAGLLGYATSASGNLTVVLKSHNPDAFVKMGYDLFMMIILSLWQITTVLLLIFGNLSPKSADKPKINLMNTLDEI